MKNIPVVFVFLLFSNVVEAQQKILPGISLSGMTGSSRFSGSEKFPSSGYSLNFETTGNFCITAGYQHMSGRQKSDMHNGTQHVRLVQNYFKFLVGYGLAFDIGDGVGVASVQYGFLTGADRLHVWLEYPNGTVSYGRDVPNAGLYRAIRVMPQVLNLRVTYTKGLTFFTGFEKVFRKKQDVFEFWDQNSVRWGAHPSQYYALNDTHGWNFFIGIGYVIRTDK